MRPVEGFELMLTTLKSLGLAAALVASAVPPSAPSIAGWPGVGDDRLRRGSLQTAQAQEHHPEHMAAEGGDAATMQSLMAAPLPARINPAVLASVNALAAAPSIKEALQLLKKDEKRFIQESIRISEIAAPTFEEKRRAKTFAALLKANGLSTVRMDAIGNVIGIRKGSGQGPQIAIIAHLDTVFDNKTNVRVSQQGNRLLGPGLTDDANALAMMLTWLRALNATRIETVGDLIFVGSVGEEGNGDLRGVKQFFKDNPSISGAVILEGALPPAVIAIQNTGSNRFQIDFKAPGGHSYGAFGQIPSAIHAQGRFIAKVADLKVPAMPKTTFTVGIVKGGRSVNTIAPDATLEIDIRSNGKNELQATTRQVMAYVDQAVAEENKRWGVNSLSATIKQIGARPGGMTAPEQPIVHTWMAAANSQDIKPQLLAGASTDAGVPISLGIPTIVVGCGGKAGGFHALTEHWDPTDTHKGVQVSFLTTVSLAGVQGIAAPTAARH